MSDERGSDAAGYLGWFFLGSIAGAATALLLAPKTGRETRELLAERGNEFLKRAQEKAGETQGRAGDRRHKIGANLAPTRASFPASLDGGPDAKPPTPFGWAQRSRAPRRWR